MRDVSLELFGDVLFSRRLLNYAERAGNLAGTFEVIADTWEEWTGQQFQTSGAEFGTPWEPLAESTIERKRRMGAAEAEQPLVLTGALALSLQGGPGAVRNITPDVLEWGTSNPDAMWHQGRERSPSNPVPRRPIFELDEARRRYTMKLLQRGLFETGGLR